MALSATFGHRSTNIDLRKLIFEDKFKIDEKLQKLWFAFLDRNKLVAPDSFSEVVTKIQSFIEPIFDKKTKNNWNFEKWEWE